MPKKTFFVWERWLPDFAWRPVLGGHVGQSCLTMRSSKKPWPRYRITVMAYIKIEPVFYGLKWLSKLDSKASLGGTTRPGAAARPGRLPHVQDPRTRGWVHPRLDRWEIVMHVQKIVVNLNFHSANVSIISLETSWNSKFKTIRREVDGNAARKRIFLFPSYNPSHKASTGFKVTSSQSLILRRVPLPPQRLKTGADAASAASPKSGESWRCSDESLMTGSSRSHGESRQTSPGKSGRPIGSESLRVWLRRCSCESWLKRPQNYTSL